MHYYKNLEVMRKGLENEKSIIFSGFDYTYSISVSILEDETSRQVAVMKELFRRGAMWTCLTFRRPWNDNEVDRTGFLKSPCSRVLRNPETDILNFDFGKEQIPKVHFGAFQLAVYSVMFSEILADDVVLRGRGRWERTKDMFAVKKNFFTRTKDWEKESMAIWTSSKEQQAIITFEVRPKPNSGLVYNLFLEDQVQGGNLEVDAYKFLGKTHWDALKGSRSKQCSEDEKHDEDLIPFTSSPLVIGNVEKLHTLSNVAFPWTDKKKSSLSIISFHFGHDASIAISLKDGKIVAALELERLFEKRYFKGPNNPKDRKEFTYIWSKAITTILESLNVSEIPTFNVVAFIEIKWGNPVTAMALQIFPTLCNGCMSNAVWVEVKHHDAHAALGFFDSPFQKSLIISYDGGGSDGTIKIFHGKKSEFGSKKNPVMELLHQDVQPFNFGVAYQRVGAYVDEVIYSDASSRCRKIIDGRAECLAIPGRAMGYTAFGTVREEWRSSIDRLFSGAEGIIDLLFHRDPFLHFLSKERQEKLQNSFSWQFKGKDGADLIRTAQDVFEKGLIKIVKQYVEKLSKENEIDGIVVTGGCALNVLANSVLAKTFHLPIHIPVAPHDGGLPIGAIWSISPPSLEKQNLAYIGLPLFDVNQIDRLAEEHDAVNLGSFNKSIEIVAQLLVEKSAVIAVVRGRQEFGPRALGHRSLLAVPTKEMLGRMNQLKARQWWRPTAPMLTVESVSVVFDLSEYGGVDILSPYMSFAPEMNEKACAALPAACHADRTARLQTVQKDDEPWIYALLKRVDGTESCRKKKWKNCPHGTTFKKTEERTGYNAYDDPLRKEAIRKENERERERVRADNEAARQEKERRREFFKLAALQTLERLEQVEKELTKKLSAKLKKQIELQKCQNTAECTFPKDLIVIHEPIDANNESVADFQEATKLFLRGKYVPPSTSIRKWALTEKVADIVVATKNKNETAAPRVLDMLALVGRGDMDNRERIYVDRIANFRKKVEPFLKGETWDDYMKLIEAFGDRLTCRDAEFKPKNPFCQPREPRSLKMYRPECTWVQSDMAQCTDVYDGHTFTEYDLRTPRELPQRYSEPVMDASTAAATKEQVESQLNKIIREAEQLKKERKRLEGEFEEDAVKAGYNPLFGRAAFKHKSDFVKEETERMQEEKKAKMKAEREADKKAREARKAEAEREADKKAREARKAERDRQYKKAKENERKRAERYTRPATATTAARYDPNAEVIVDTQTDLDNAVKALENSGINCKALTYVRGNPSLMNIPDPVSESRAYNQIRLQLHPDKNKDCSKFAEAVFKRIENERSG
eukprot:g2677.t1